MKPDDDLNLNAAFAELRRRRQTQAPAFAPMREKALREASASVAAGRLTRAAAPLAWACAACAVAVGVWRAAQLSQDNGAPIEHASAGPAVEELIASIEQHLEVEQGSSPLEYPTDRLLVENPATFAR